MSSEFFLDLLLVEVCPRGIDPPASRDAVTEWGENIGHALKDRFVDRGIPENIRPDLKIKVPVLRQGPAACPGTIIRG
jgi:hypothetical protein